MAEAKDPETDYVVVLKGSDLPLDTRYIDGSWEMLVGIVSDEEIEELKRDALDAAELRERERAARSSGLPDPGC